MTPTLTGARVAIVSGKGGVGKTTIATSLALAAAAQGKNVLLAELEDREAFAPLFGLERLAYTPQPIAARVHGMTIEADEALVEYLRLFYGIPKVSRALIRSKAIEFATHTAPGLQDILLIGKIRQAEGERTEGGTPRYDLIVVDAPPTGRLPRFLDAPRAIVELVGAGPIRRQAKGVLDMIRDPSRLQVILVSLAEAMSVEETTEAAATLDDLGVARGPVIVNGLVDDVPGLGRDPTARLDEAARDAGLELDVGAVATLSSIATHQAARARRQRATLKDLHASVDGPSIEVPYIATEIGREQIAAIGELLTGSGLL